MIFDRSYKRLLYQVVAGTIVFLAIVLVGLLAAASANTEFFDRYFTLLYKVNLVIGVLLVVIIGGLMLALALRARRGKFGTRLMTKLAVFFGVVGVLPGVLIYLVSLQFVSRSIESWFDVKVESALEAGLNLGRSTMDTALADLQNKGRLIAEQVGDGSASATAITLNRLREQFGVQEATIFTASGRVIATVSTDDKEKLARDAGADEVVRYDGFAENVRRLTGGVHVVYDGVGKTTFDDSMSVLRPRGMLALYGAASGPVPPVDPQRLNVAGSLFLTRPTLVHYVATREELQWRTRDIFGWIASGDLSVHIGGRYPLEEARRAHDDLEGRRTTGKLLLVP